MNDRFLLRSLRTDRLLFLYNGMMKHKFIATLKIEDLKRGKSQFDMIEIYSARGTGMKFRCRKQHYVSKSIKCTKRRKEFDNGTSYVIGKDILDQ